MNLKDIIWNKKTYQEFIEYLKNNVDIEYKIFNTRIINTNKLVIGNRMPFLRKCAQEISRGDYLKFFELNNHQTYEETTIHGLIIGYAKIDIDTTLLLLDNFINHIDNWATNDVVASTLKTFKINQKEGYIFINKLINSNNPWQIRFGLILLLCHYINDDYIENTIQICRNVNYDHYYVKMGNAWLLSMCYVKYPNLVLDLLRSNKLDKWTHNKTIQKIKESYQVTKEQKEYINRLKK